MALSLIQLLQQHAYTATAEEIADIAWLLLHMGAADRDSAPDQPAGASQTIPLPSVPGSSFRQTGATPTDSEPASTAPLHGYSASGATDGAAGGQGLAIALAGSAALAQQRLLARALRPLMRRVAAPLRRALDESASAQVSAEWQMHWPVTRPLLERRWEIALVIDDAPSMQIWHQTIAEWRSLLEYQGAFRCVRLWTLQTDDRAKVQLRSGWGRAASQPRHTRELLSPNGRQIILVLSDTVAPAWQDQGIIELLHEWAAHAQVTILHMLPPPFWHRTALRRYEEETLTSSPDTAARPGGDEVAVQVTHLRPRALQRWAARMAGDSAAVHAVLVSRDAPPIPAAASSALDGSARERQFRLAASPPAWRLAQALATVPLSLPLMRLVHRLIDPQAPPEHMAEVLLGGLLRRSAPTEQPTAADTVLFDFYPGVREVLLHSLTVADRAVLLRAVSEAVMAQKGKAFSFRGMLLDPAGNEYARLSQTNPAFAEISTAVLQSMGGAHARFAERLEHKTALPGEETAPPSDAQAQEQAERQGSGNTQDSAVDLELTIGTAGPAYRAQARCDPSGLDEPFAAAATIQIDPMRLRALALDVYAYGLELGRMVLVGAIGTLFGQARALAERDSMPLRVRLVLTDADELHTLRWETLRDPTRPDAPLLTAGSQLLFSRYMSSRDWTPATPRPSYRRRALVLLASPSDLPDYGLAPLDLAAERTLIEHSFGSIPLTVLSGRQATVETLTQHLHEDYDILYLLAHGRTDEEGETWLFLEDANGQTAPTRGTELATRIAEMVRRPRLVILGSSESAGDGYSPPLVALGPRLAQAGVPAVLAMQGSITLETQRRFLSACLQELERDGRIDRAVAIARGQVRERPDFWVPVLFLGLRGGQLWVASNRPPASPNPFAKDAPPQRPEDIAMRQEMLAMYRQNVKLLLQQSIRSGGTAYASLKLLNDLTDGRKNIAQCKAILRTWGIPVEDDPDDVQPDRLTDDALPMTITDSESPPILPTPFDKGRPPQRPEDIARQQKMLAQFRQNVQILLEQIARYGGAAYAPLSLLNDLIHSSKQIALHKAILRRWGLPVEDYPDDALPDWLADLEDYPDDALPDWLADQGLPPQRREDIARQQEMLAQARQNVEILLQQIAQQGRAYAPIILLNTLTEARKNIAQCKATLRGWGIQVKDYPNDALSAQLADVLLVTVTDAETQAVFEALLAETGQQPRPRDLGGRTYYDLGLIGGARVWLVRSESGSITPGGSFPTLYAALEAARPAAVLLVGIAFGTDPTMQSIGDVLVATQLLFYDQLRVSAGPAGEARPLPRGDRPTISSRLLNRCREAALSWPDSQARVRFGLMLSGEKLINHAPTAASLLDLEPEAIGGEMEGAGLYVAATERKVDWGLIKAIGDWADGHKYEDKKERQALAARNAAAFALHVLATDGFAPEAQLE